MYQLAQTRVVLTVFPWIAANRIHAPFLNEYAFEIDDPERDGRH